jgi:uncharacterized membrane protein
MLTRYFYGNVHYLNWTVTNLVIYEKTRRTEAKATLAAKLLQNRVSWMQSSVEASNSMLLTPCFSSNL